MFEVYAFRLGRSPYQDGKGARHHTFRQTVEDRPSALRLAQHLVEAGGYDTCSVKAKS